MGERIHDQGYEAHSQNEPREANSYCQAAKDWDDGWVEREQAQRKHRLDPEEVASFVEHVAGLFT